MNFKTINFNPCYSEKLSCYGDRFLIPVSAPSQTNMGLSKAIVILFPYVL